MIYLGLIGIFLAGYAIGYAAGRFIGMRAMQRNMFKQMSLRELQRMQNRRMNAVIEILHKGE